MAAFAAAVRKEECDYDEIPTLGRFGIHGGQYTPETLMNAVIELEEAYNQLQERS